MRKNNFLYSILFFLLMFLDSNCIAGESQMQVRLWKELSTVNLSELNSYINSLSLLADGATVPSIDTIKTGEASGCRYARISKMKQKENNDTALVTITNGDLLRDLLGNDIVCDYSGITISISANLSFERQEDEKGIACYILNI